MTGKSRKIEDKDGITQYTFEEENRLNIPQTGLVSAETDPIDGKKRYMFDPHLEPEFNGPKKLK